MTGSTALAGTILAEAGQVAARERRFLVVALLIASTPGLLAIVLLPPGAARGPAIVSAFATLYLQLLATARTLHALGAMPADYRRVDATERRFPAAFLGTLFYLLAVGGGLVLLVVPGVAAFLLLGLWLPAMVAERLGVADAFRRSFALARPRLRALALVALVSGAALVAAVAVPFAMVGLTILFAWPVWVDRMADAVAEVTIAAFLIGNAVIWSAAFSEVRREPNA